MKLRLPRHLILAFVLASSVLPSMAAVRHTDVSLNTYVDFATNSGRYATGVTNELLDYIRTQEGGVTIHYTGGQESYVLPNGMISFDSVADDGNMTVVGYNYVVTVAHNSSQMSPTFSWHDYGIGDEKAIKYLSAEEYGENKNFVNDIADYKLSRLTKLVTDAPVAQMAGGSGTDYKGQLVYRTAGGYQKIRDAEGKSSDETEKLTYQVGGIGSINSWNQTTDPSVRTADITGTTSWDPSGVGEGSPLPFGGQEGDSGSPYFVWDAETGSFKLLMVHSGSHDKNGKPEQTIGYEATDWAQSVMAADSFTVDMSKVASNTLNINGADVDEKGSVITETKKFNIGTEESPVYVSAQYSVKAAQSYLSDGTGAGVQDKNYNSYFFAVETGSNTWNDLSGLKNSDNWYAYGNEYLNATYSVVLDKANNPVVMVDSCLTYSELYRTQNLVLEAHKDDITYSINVVRDTDLGVGYLHFAANGHKNVKFDVKQAGSNQLNSAGYVVDAGVQVNVSLCNTDASYMREWRKVGEGTLNICGTDNNEIFLNIGGAGKTLLNQEKGYAAYNVLVNTGSTVVIKDTSQIYRDLTFGNGGGVLDMNGNSMDWYTTKGQSRTNAFTINALTEEAVITNNSATHVELTYMESGNTRFVGSFRDSKDSSLGITYSVEGGTWELNSIRTSLTHKDSGLTVASGTVKLAGTLTVHGYGTEHDKYSADFSTSEYENDWHYADAAMNVTVKDGATFELESHARLTGNVTVKNGGSYIMHEGVQDEEEYIEGGEKLEKTAAIADYYGHKGDVSLEGTGSLTWKRGDKEVATLKTNGAGTAEMAKVESTISSETQLRLAAAKGETARLSAASLVALQTGVSLELCGLYVDAASAISSANGANVSLHESTLELSSANTLSSTASLDRALTLNLCGDTTSVMTLAAGTEVLDLESSILSGSLTLSCEQFVLDLRSLETPVNGWVRVSFGDNVKFAAPGEMTLSAMVDVGYAAGYYSDAHVGFVYFYIPEPATTSLSLLALAALAARRRRK